MTGLSGAAKLTETNIINDNTLDNVKVFIVNEVVTFLVIVICFLSQYSVLSAMIVIRYLKKAEKFNRSTKSRGLKSPT